MEIFTEAEHRTLAYVSAANRGGYRPTDPNGYSVGARWGNEDPDCRITAGQGPLSTRSPVVGKSDTPAAGAAERG